MTCPELKGLALEADGSGMYTLRALWTMARENRTGTLIFCVIVVTVTGFWISN